MLVIVLSVAIFTTNAEALPEPKVTITYSLRVDDGGSYRQEISGTLLGLGDVDYLCAVSEEDPPEQPGPDLDDNVVVFVDDPLLVTLEFTADPETGDIIDGDVEITDTHFERDFDIDSGLVLVNTVLSTVLSRVGTGELSGSTITWDNVEGVNAYQETVVGEAICTGGLCPFETKDVGGVNEVVLPDFTVGMISVFGDTFVSDHGTPSDNTDDILRQDDDEAFVVDTWTGMEFVPEPSREVLLLAGVLGLAGLTRLRERGGVSALFANRR
jgi:hypothetical protein